MDACLKPVTREENIEKLKNHLLSKFEKKTIGLEKKTISGNLLPA